MRPSDLRRDGPAAERPEARPEPETVYSQPAEQAEEVEKSLEAASADLAGARGQLEKTEREIRLFSAGVEMALRGGLKDEAGELDKLVGHLSEDADKLRRIVAELDEVQADYRLQSDKLRQLDRLYDHLLRNGLKNAGKQDIH